jgi:DNA-binding transcriptional regulator YiaG
MTPRDLDRILRELGLTRAAAARVLHRSERHLYDWLRGRYPIPNQTAAVLRLMRAGKFTADELRDAAGCTENFLA